MKKKHAPREVAHVRMGGYELTPHEDARMKHRKDWHISCKKCQVLLK